MCVENYRLQISIYTIYDIHTLAVLSVIALLTSHHKRIVENLELIFSDMPAGNAERSSQDVSRNIGITFTEAFSPDDFLNATAHPSLHGAGFEVLK